MRISRSLLQQYFSDPLPTAEKLAELFTFHAFEVEGIEQVGDDAVIDVDVLANRSSDCLSHRGIARELSTILGVPMKYDPFREPLTAYGEASQLTVSIEDHTLCSRYLGAHVRGVVVGPSPEWLVQALAKMGQKSINNLVDATNYVMFTLGQPLHVFDFDKLEKDGEGVRRIEVRRAHAHEPFVALSGETYSLMERHLVIADGVSGAPLALAGIKGGREAEVSLETTEIVVEAAHFNYVSVRKTSRELKVQTDASVRFQNDPSPLLAGFAMRDVLMLITEIAGGTVVGVSEVFHAPTSHAPVPVTLSDVHSLLGTRISVEDVERIFVRFEFDFSRDGERFTVSPPFERTDLTCREELIEEVGRIYGYGNITGTLPSPGLEPPERNPGFELSERLRRFLDEEGYAEVMTYTLCDEGEVELQNPLASDKAFLRKDLHRGLAEALEKNAWNAPLLGLDSVRLFELGPVFRGGREETVLGIGVKAVRGKQSAIEKGLRDTLTAIIGMFGLEEVPEARDGIAELVLSPEVVAAAGPHRDEPALPWNTQARYTPWSPYPFSTRDIAVWVPEGVAAEEVLAVVVEKTSALLVRHDLFDTFTKEGKTSYAYHLVFQAPDRTLTDEEVLGEMSAVEAGMRGRGWEVR